MRNKVRRFVWGNSWAPKWPNQTVPTSRLFYPLGVQLPDLLQPFKLVIISLTNKFDLRLKIIKISASNLPLVSTWTWRKCVKNVPHTTMTVTMRLLLLLLSGGTRIVCVQLTSINHRWDEQLKLMFIVFYLINLLYIINNWVFFSVWVNTFLEKRWNCFLFEYVIN